MSAPLAEFGGWPGLLGPLLERQDLTGEAAAAGLSAVLAGEATPAQIAAFIVALRVKGESVDEVAGMVGSMLAAAAPLELPEGTIDIVGTGGSPRRRIAALNVSTMACIVASAAGATVCKHGNTKASSTSGSFDLLDELGIGYAFGADELADVVRDVGLGFCFARAYHPAMRHAGPVRAELGVPTVLNVLGPLSHPGHVRRQVIGVGDERLLDLVAGTLAARGVDHALVVLGDGSLDEIAITGATEIREVRGSAVTAWRFDPSDADLASVSAEAVPGGSPADNARIARALFAGELGPARDVVRLNAGAGLYVAGIASSIAAGAELAAHAIDSGAAAAKLDSVVARTAGS